MVAATVTTLGRWNLVPEASGRARDALDNAFGAARTCPQSAPDDRRKHQGAG
jgi:hypothetical protein